ncbi:uncharacterized protein PHACADRAFT_188459 [Phanerochaete carnosa HHB-10118-sp]|uniref:HMG box domain-containing protein n=1 Tax=Phanerochaete carnosa (strain HHB-10118-sp) TaxID=650164 RepID=K5WIM8_PHACS|nr:uncharacterized protein PHACADRAFT_188459 [Phanerochaete carnosa HHB-10118-sp]EKM50102.1 hypothetical protein PHACADRAFT_188459 [Phanerochaete carnosa HHB-10118-sp]
MSRLENTKAQRVLTPLTSMTPLRRTKKPEGHIPRPPNRFFLFRRDFCANLKLGYVDPSLLKPNTSISGAAGEAWRRLSEEERKLYKDKEKEEKKKHEAMYPNYTFRPQRKNKKNKKASPSSKAITVSREQSPASVATSSQFQPETYEGESSDEATPTASTLATPCDDFQPLGEPAVLTPTTLPPSADVRYARNALGLSGMYNTDTTPTCRVIYQYSLPPPPTPHIVSFTSADLCIVFRRLLCPTCFRTHAASFSNNTYWPTAKNEYCYALRSSLCRECLVLSGENAREMIQSGIERLNRREILSQVFPPAAVFTEMPNAAPEELDLFYEFMNFSGSS